MADINVSMWLDRYQQAMARKRQSDGLRQEAGMYSWPEAKDQTRNIMESEGQLNTINLYDSTAMMAAYTMTSGIFSYLMPVGAFWFGFTAQDPEINKDPAMLQWMSTASSLTHKEIWRSNFQREMFLAIRSMIVFGTGIISVEMVGKEIVFQSHHVGFMAFDDNDMGEIDTVYRQIFYTARQALQKFGNVDLGKDVNKAVKANKMEEKFEFVHITAPNKDFDKDKTGSKSKKTKSVYINVKDKLVVKEGGFDELPYLVARFALVPGDIMGRGPAIELLPEIKMLNRMKKTFIEQSEKAVNPPLVMEDDSVIGTPVTSPGGTIYVRAGSQFPAPLPTGTNVELNAEIIREQQILVKEGFFNNRFQSLADHRNMTAFEAGIRKEDDLTIVSPAITSLQKETLDPMLSRVLNLLIKSKRIPPPPVSFDFDIAYQGRLSLAMASVQANAMEATLAKFAPYVPLKPEIFENIDFDKVIRESWLASGAPAGNLVDFEEMVAARKEIQDMQKAQAQADIGDTASKAYKNASQVADDGSPASALTA
jgi:hypothetical protein